MDEQWDMVLLWRRHVCVFFFLSYVFWLFGQIVGGCHNALDNKLRKQIKTPDFRWGVSKPSLLNCHGSTPIFRMKTSFVLNTFHRSRNTHFLLTLLKIKKNICENVTTPLLSYGLKYRSTSKMYTSNMQTNKQYRWIWNLTGQLPQINIWQNQNSNSDPFHNLWDMLSTTQPRLIFRRFLSVQWMHRNSTETKCIQWKVFQRHMPPFGTRCDISGPRNVKFHYYIYRVNRPDV